MVPQPDPRHLIIDDDVTLITELSQRLGSFRRRHPGDTIRVMVSTVPADFPHGERKPSLLVILDRPATS